MAFPGVATTLTPDQLAAYFVRIGASFQSENHSCSIQNVHISASFQSEDQPSPHQSVRINDSVQSREQPRPHQNGTPQHVEVTNPSWGLHLQQPADVPSPPAHHSGSSHPPHRNDSSHPATENGTTELPQQNGGSAVLQRGDSNSLPPQNGSTQLQQQHNHDSLPPPNLATLWHLHERHVLAIPFENLSVFHPAFQAPIVLDLEQLFDKLVTRKRGGYCYEMNSLFAAVLRTLGYTLYYGSTYSVLPMLWEPPEPSLDPQPIGLSVTGSHVILHVLLPDEGHWICDTGFGRTGLAHPVPLVPSAASLSAAAKAAAAAQCARADDDAFDVHRVVPALRGSTAQPTALDYEQQPHRCGYFMSWWSPNHGGFVPQYWFRAASEVYHGDMEAYNTFASTHPNSPVRQILIITRPTPTGRVAISGWLPDQLTLRVRRRYWKSLEGSKSSEGSADANIEKAATLSAVARHPPEEAAAAAGDPAAEDGSMEPPQREAAVTGASGLFTPISLPADMTYAGSDALQQHMRAGTQAGSDALQQQMRAGLSLDDVDHDGGGNGIGSHGVGSLRPGERVTVRKVVEVMESTAITEEQLPQLLLEHFGIGP